MTESATITRRTFLAAGVAVGTMGLVLQEGGVTAQGSLERLVKEKTFGGIEYIQLHCTGAFPLATALRTVETVTKGYTLEKVSAAGEPDFEQEPKHFLATFYYKEGFRATLSSGPSPHSSLGTVRGEAGDIIVSATRLEVLDKAGKLQESLTLNHSDSDEAPSTLAYIVQALREGVTVFPGVSGH